jgi:hypothetical protein
MRRLILLLALTCLTTQATAQAGQQQGKKKDKNASGAQVELQPHEAAKIFTAEEPLTFTVKANLGRLKRDKGQNPPWRAARISYVDSAGQAVEVPARTRTRGIWRLRECDFPPLRLNFAKDSVKHTVFAKLDKPKLVTHCKDNENYEQYLLQEMQLYRIYNLLTPYSHRVRLARVIYADSGSGKIETTRYAFLEEEPEALAHRIGAMVVKQQGATMSDLVPSGAVLFSVFQYLIGNTDWSINGLHNVELITSDSLHVPIAYDFDFAGAVNARYATVDSRLPIRSVRQRLYRGYCAGPEDYAPVFALFQSKRDSIYALYRDPIGRLIEPGRVKETLAYFDEFYKTINDPREAKREIVERCLGR